MKPWKKKQLEGLLQLDSLYAYLNLEHRNNGQKLRERKINDPYTSLIGKYLKSAKFHVFSFTNSSTPCNRYVFSSPESKT